MSWMAELAAFGGAVVVSAGVLVVLTGLFRLLDVAGRFKRLGRPAQTTFCWCPRCNLELCSTGPEVKCWHDAHGLVNYECTCGQRSTWDFDMPVPLLLSPPSKSRA